MGAFTKVEQRTTLVAWALPVTSVSLLSEEWLDPLPLPSLEDPAEELLAWYPEEEEDAPLCRATWPSPATKVT